MVLLQCAVLLTGCALLVGLREPRGVCSGVRTAGALAAAVASDADVSEAGSARAIVERPDDCEGRVRPANDLFHGVILPLLLCDRGRTRPAPRDIADPRGLGRGERQRLRVISGGGA